MEKRPSLLNKALNLNNSLLFIVGFAFALDFLFSRFLYYVLGGYTLLIYFAVTIYFYSGVFGSIIDIVSGEQIIISLSSFTKHAKETWKTYALIFAIPFAIYSVLSISNIILPVSLSEFIFCMHTVVLVLYILIFIKKEYAEKYSLKKRKVIISLRDSMTLIILLLSQVVIFFIQKTYFIMPSIVKDICNISLLYLYFLEFIFISFVVISNSPEIHYSFKGKKELFLIAPGGRAKENLAAKFLFHYPAFFIVLKALTPKDYLIREFPWVCWYDRYYKSNVLVAITAFSSNVAEAYKIAKEFKKRGSTVVMGGPHVSFLPYEALEFCDSVVIGDGTSMWPEVIKDYENGELKQKYYGEEKEYPKAIHQELMNSTPRMAKNFIQATRGCKYKCDFCTVSTFCGGYVRRKPIEEVVEVIKNVRKKYKNINFIDNNIYSDPYYAKDLMIALKTLDVKWTASSSIDIAKDEEILKLAKESGCEMIHIGYEITGDSFEKAQKGKFSLADKYFEYTKRIKKAGIRIKGSFMFGFDSDDIKSYFKLWMFCFRINPFYSVVSIYTPLPGSKVYFNMLEHKRILSQNWRSYTMMSFVISHKTRNNPIFNCLHPLTSYFFLFTTSAVGYVLIILLLVSIFWFV